MPAGNKLRVLADEPFGLVWTVDDWKTVNNKASRPVGCAGHFADMGSEPGQEGRMIFTMKWRPDDRWEGRNFEVRLHTGDDVLEDAAEDAVNNQETAVAQASS